MKKQSVKKQPTLELAAQVRLDVKSDTPSYYVNFMAVTHTAYDFTLSATRIPSPFTPDQLELAKNGEQIPIEPLIQLIMPPLLVDGLIKALTIQQEQHQKTLAQQVKNNEAQHYIKPTDSVQ